MYEMLKLVNISANIHDFSFPVKIILKCAKFRKTSKLSTKFVDVVWHFENKIYKSEKETKRRRLFAEMFEVWAVRKHVELVDLVKNLWIHHSNEYKLFTSKNRRQIQPRPSFLKFHATCKRIYKHGMPTFGKLRSHPNALMLDRRIVSPWIAGSANYEVIWIVRNAT